MKTTTRIPGDSPSSGHALASHASPKSSPAEASAAACAPSPQTRYAPLLFLLLLTLALRLPGVTRPLVGNFATKSAVYGMVARNLAEGQASVLHPTLDVLRGGRRSFHLTELPVSAYVTAGLWKLFGGSLDVWGRATSIAWSLIAIGCFYVLLRDWHGESVARGGAAALALSPVAVIYGQSFQLEASLLALSVLTVWSADRWLTENNPRWMVVAVIAATLLLLTKIYMAYLILPLLYLAWRRRGGGVFRSAAAWCAVTIAALPAAAWYGYVYFAAAGGFGFDPERVYYSVRQSASVHHFPHPLLGSADFYKHLLDDLTGVVLTPIGFVLALLGTCRGINRRYLFWLAGCGLLVLLLPRKFYEMNYYWLAVLLPLCALAGIGLSAMFESTLPKRGATGSRLPVPVGSSGRARADKPPVVPETKADEKARRSAKLIPYRSGLILIGGVWLVLSLRLSMTPAFSTPPEDASVVDAGQAVQRISRPEARVITLHGSSLDLLYYCNRPGWVLPTKDSQPAARWIETYRTEGAAYLVVAGLKQFDAIPGLSRAVEDFPIAAEGSDYIVYHLANPQY